MFADPFGSEPPASNSYVCFNDRERNKQKHKDILLTRSSPTRSVLLFITHDALQQQLLLSSGFWTEGQLEPLQTVVSHGASAGSEPAEFYCLEDGPDFWTFVFSLRGRLDRLTGQDPERRDV